MTQPRETSLLEEAEKAPIRRPAKATARPSAPTASQYNKVAVRKALESLYEAAGGGIFLFDPQCAAIFNDEDFVKNAVESWLNLAEVSPFWKKMLGKLATTSGWGGVVMAHMPLVMAIASHHTDFGKQMAMFAAGQVGENGREANPDNA